jgi:hypothetical protein
MVRHPGEHLIDVERVTVALTSTLQTPGRFGTELDAPESDGFVANGNTAFSQEILYIAMAEIKAVV